MINNLVIRRGVVQATLILTLGSIFVSLAVMLALAGLFGTGVGFREIAAAIIIPVLLIPFIGNETFPLLGKLYSAEQTAQLLATADPLTLAFNRKRFVELVGSELALAQRYGEKFSILLFDLDNFKGINDAYGHHVGDHVLRTASEMCRSQMRRSDILARLGEDEFACLLPHTPEVGALEFAERLRTTIAEKTLSVEKSQVEFTISVGIKTLHAETDGEPVLRAAEQALGEAKRAGKNRTIAARKDQVIEIGQLAAPKVPSA
jgi:diguanylate cyclase (GGDEF)-like protein